MFDGNRGGRSGRSFYELDCEKWPSVNSDILPETLRNKYEHRKSAVKSYASGEKIKDVAARCRFSTQFIIRMFNRCMQPHHDGNIWGFRALIPYIHVKQYRRKDSASSGAGSFQKLLLDYPQIEHDLTSVFFGHTDSRLSSNRIGKGSYFGFFKKLCVEAGIQKDQYPFNTVNCGKRSLDKYLDYLGTCKEGVMAMADLNTRRHLALGGGANIFSKASRPYRRVAFDGHSVDSCWVISFEDQYGKRFQMVLERFWLLLILDENSGAVIGYSTSVRRKYNRVDVIRAIADALNPAQKEVVKPLSISITDDGRSESIRNVPGLKWILWDEFTFDNDKANISHDVRETLRRVGCSVNAGPVAFPEKRAILERFFETLESSAFRVIPGSLGTGPEDPIRQLAEKYAIAYRLTFEDLLYILEESITWYNQRGRHRNYYTSPLQVISNFVNNPDNIVVRVNKNLRVALSRLGPKYITTIRGDVSDGTRPYVTVLGEPYSSESLELKWDLLGRKLVCYVQPDARFVDAYDENGMALGILTVKSYWRDFPHTYETRALVNAKKANLIRDELNMANPVIEISQKLKTRKERKTAAREAMAISEDRKLRVPFAADYEEIVQPSTENDLKGAYKLKGRVIGEGSSDNS